MLQITPSILSLYLNQYPEIIERMKVLLVGGEIFTKTLAHQLFCHNSGRIYNLYGLTELAIWTTVKEIKRDNTISVGKPICNNKVYILNDYLQPQEPYTEGTVYISGFGVHANLLSGDNSRFIEIPELEERFLYNTNDIGFLDSHGELTIVGRKDNEIKFHGIRIQPAEIESVLEGISGVRGAVVALQGELREQVIVAYLVLDISIDLYQIQSYMRDKLPIEFIPSIYYKIDQIYLNKNGKRDMDKICEKAIRIITEGTEPLDKFEQEIVTIIKEKLGIEYTSVEDNIFFIGVTSILVIIIRNELEKVFDIKLDLINLYEHPTVKKLAVFIKTLISGRMENKDEK